MKIPFKTGNLMILRVKNKLFDLQEPIVMGILNNTPDSFYQFSRLGNDKNILKKVERMVKEGVDILDVGAYSTRPQADFVSQEEEISRLSDVLEIIVKNFPEVLVSVDTFRSPVARLVVEKYGVSMINDVSGGSADSMMFETIVSLKVAYVLMHSRGNPQTMQEMTDYENLVGDVLHFLSKRIAQLHILGVTDVIADPGFGFAKTLEQNYELLAKLHYFKELNVPILAGISRKSMIYKYLQTDPENALTGTTAAHMLALMQGASILRVHDVQEAVETIKIYKAFKSAGLSLK